VLYRNGGKLTAVPSCDLSQVRRRRLQRRCGRAIALAISSMTDCAILCVKVRAIDRRDGTYRDLAYRFRPVGGELSTWTSHQYRQNRNLYPLHTSIIAPLKGCANGLPAYTH